MIEEMMSQGIVTSVTCALAETIGKYSDDIFDWYRRELYTTRSSQDTTYSTSDVETKECKKMTTSTNKTLHDHREPIDIFNHSKKFLVSYAENFKEFLQSSTSKKLRFFFQRAINLPINSLTVGSGSELTETYDKLRSVFEGQVPTSIDYHSEGIHFCKNLFAKAVLQQGENLVSTKPEMAFGLAAVIVTLCNDIPDLIELLLAHLRISCPYLCPVLLDQSEGQSPEDYKRSLGYKFIDGTIEKKEFYLNRMSGIIKLYAAIIVARLKRNENRRHPHGLENAWSLLNVLINFKLVPEHVDAIATVIHDILQTCGSSMIKENPSQLKILINNINENYFSELKKNGASPGPIGRLGLIIGLFYKQGHFPEPEGQLPIEFW
ncbi:mRNA export factor GLE1-like [Microplitis mediator]|uniref:mRNA export factor GLE1-like n=1 Tax=Microplitis mediator TaxID=375433 RepID=UPI0025545C8A|nr:mRNA export factor GLE1-like [Microplitis mediator]